ncbi:MAG: helicase-related protein [Gemmatimonadales bacterium]
MSEPPVLDDGFRLGAAAPLSGVLAALARAVRPGSAPGWLLPTQRRAFHRGLEIAGRFGGVMLALPVGTGKTYLSLAIAARLAGSERIAVLAPAILRRQWLDVAGQVSVPIDVVSHEAASRGVVPAGAGPVIIDESQRFRTRTTRRYRAVAPALVGRPVVLATATPIVNRPDDLVAQLQLAVPDDALAPLGFGSLAMLPWPPDGASPSPAATGGLPSALEALVVREEPGGVPTTIVRRVAAGEDPRLDRTVARIARLRLARDPGVARLIRGSMLKALASSPAALGRVVDRYRRLLGHAARAHRAGHSINRRRILAAVGAEPDQLLFWELLPAETEPADLALADLSALGGLAGSVARWAARGDAKRTRLVELLADRRPTAVFTTAIATADYVRQAFTGGGVAWVTGQRAGLGTMRVPRAMALGGFEAAYPWIGGRRPWLLVATDVAAEGLNLDLVARVVHYDLPWTAVRLTQRAGRATRLSSRHAEVEVIRFELPAALEAALSLERSIERKGGLPALAGLVSRHLAWRDRLEDWAEAEPIGGWSVADRGRPLAAVCRAAGCPADLWTERDDRTWTNDPTEVAHAVAGLGEAPSGATLGPADVVAALAALRRSLAAAEVASEIDPLLIDRRTARGLRAVGRQGAVLAQARRWTEVAAADRALRFLRRGHRAGEAALARSVVANDPSARATAARLVETPKSAPRLVALVLVARAEAAG